MLVFVLTERRPNSANTYENVFLWVATLVSIIRTLFTYNIIFSSIFDNTNSFFPSSINKAKPKKLPNPTKPSQQANQIIVHRVKSLSMSFCLPVGTLRKMADGGVDIDLYADDIESDFNRQV